MTFNEITPTAVRRALAAPRAVDAALVDAAKVRRFMDRLVGYRASRFSRSWSLTSMGRVQTPTLGSRRARARAGLLQLPTWKVQQLQ